MKIPGILHVHSTYSDGKLDLVDIRALCERAGLRFVCMSEHTDGLSRERAQAFIDKCEEYSGGDFLMIPGFEVPYHGMHILVFGVHEYSFNENDCAESLEKCVRKGAIAVIAHPQRNGFRTDRRMRELCIGAEVWNSQYDGKRFPRWTALRWFKAIARIMPEFRALAGLDLHRRSHFGGPRVVVNAPTIAESVVLDAIRNGEYLIESRFAVLNARGALLRPCLFAAYIGSMMDVVLVQLARYASRIAKSTGFSRTSMFRRMREKIRKTF